MAKVFKKGSEVKQVFFSLTIQLHPYSPEMVIIVLNELSGKYHFEHYYGTDIFGSVYGSDGKEYPSVVTCIQGLYRHLASCFKL